MFRELHNRFKFKFL